MKRVLSFLLIPAFLFALTSCAAQEEDLRFYYLRSKFVYGAEDGVIAAEERETGNDNRDLNYLLRLYLEGPLSDTYLSPFPRGVYLLSTQMEDACLKVILSEEFTTLQDMDLALAAGCLASTCFGLTDAQQVQIHASSPDGTMTITLTRDSLTLVDNSATTATESTGE